MTPHRISVVIPVYQGELTLPGIVDELDRYTRVFTTPDGHDVVVSEVLLVFDHGPDGSARVIRELSEKYDYVRGVWLSRNFGQHPATFAGMASSGGDWIITMDEDGQHDPAYIAGLVDVALRKQASIVYAQPTNAAPHGPIRNVASKGAKVVVAALTGSKKSRDYQSFRLVLGEVGRSVAAYAGPGVYLDVALGWVAGTVATAPIELRSEGDRPSGYSMRKLLSHFWRMVLSSGTRGLRAVSVLGVVFAVCGVVLAVIIGIQRITGGQIEAGWTSIMVTLLFSTGAILFSLGVVAEYIGVAVNMAIGKPLYLIVSDPGHGPLGRAKVGRGTPAP